jgi:lipopolysaccharide/colanic/teichoic acid biosynthesis glycosyltransferase
MRSRHGGGKWMMGYLFFKRLLDLFGSILGLVVLSPLLLGMAVWVSVESPGGPFYRQIRVGRLGRPFKLFKFRSMRVASDQKGLLTIGNDPRITRSGAFLRRYKLDELPQLLNVLVGEMSLVGPRPEVPLYVERYTEAQRAVLSVKPGITDWASIKYFEENRLLAESDQPEQTYIQEIMPDKLALNLEYIRTRSFGKDIQILWQTVVRIFN